MLSRARAATIAMTLGATIAAVSCGGSAYSGGEGNPIAPSISTQPANQTVNAGQTRHVLVVVAGSPLRQLSMAEWRRGSNISGPRRRSHTTPSTVAKDTEKLFR